MQQDKGGYQDAGSEAWRLMLSGEHPLIRKGRRFWGMVPSDPRCKMCNSPYKGLGGVISRMRGRGPSNWSPNLCHLCETFTTENPGGIELEISMVFVDVRNSTELSEHTSPAHFAEAMNRFYEVATGAMTDRDGIIDKLVGDEVVALFLPAFTGDDHAAQAMQACRDLFGRIGYGSREGPFLEIGAGVNTGTAYVGSVGGGGQVRDFTALGEEVNLTARMAEAAAPGEILYTEGTRKAAGLTPGPTRELVAKGFAHPIVVNVLAAERMTAG